jgi:tetratricopeptide (TPR) repeat protein
MKNKIYYPIFIIFTIGLIFLLSTSSTLGQENLADEPFDLSKYEEEIKESGIPTPGEVETLKEKANKLFNDGNYQEAEKAFEKWAKSANWLANIVTSGLEPFYGASYDDRDNFAYSKVSKISSYESLANDLKRQRNKAMVLRAESLAQLNNNEKAVQLYIKSLELININNWDLWIRAANGLYEIVNVEKIEK